MPSADIASLYHKNNILYAGGKNIIYISQDKGLTWDSSSIIPQLFLVTGIIVYKNELYATAPNKGVYKSADGGSTWQNISAGILPNISAFCEFRGELYAATLGNSIYKLDPAGRDSWISFSNGLGSLSLNTTAIASTNSTLIAGTNNNGLYDYLPANSVSWEERFLLSQVSADEGAYDIITAHDTLFWPGKTGKFFMSTDNGLNWNLFASRLNSSYTTLVNAKQALVSSIRFFNGANFLTAFFYIKKDSLRNPFVNFDVVPDHFTWKIDILGDKLWDASDHGLFFMPLSALPGISAADDSMDITLPVSFISFNAKCESDKTTLVWKTTLQQNISHFNIEKSVDNTNWTTIGNLPAIGNSEIENEYFFTDGISLQSSLYRVAQYNIDGKVIYSSIVHSTCDVDDVVKSWPNPVHDILFMNIISGNQSHAAIKLFGSKGALVKTERAILVRGDNRLVLDISSLVNGVYFLLVEWKNGLMKKTMQIVKQ